MKWLSGSFNIESVEYYKLLNVFINEVQKINEILSVKKDWWETQLAGSFFGFVFAFLVFWITTYPYEKWKTKKEERESQKCRLNAVMVSFDSIVSTLLLFKKDFLEPYTLAIKQVVGEDNANSDEIRRKEFRKIISMESNFILKDFPNQIFAETFCSKNLGFMVNERPEHLYTFHKIEETLPHINRNIEERNSFIKRRMARYSDDEMGERNNEIVIDMFCDFSKALNEHVDSALAFIKFGAEHIEEYSLTFFQGENLYKFRTVCTSVEKLIPPDDYIKNYRETINNCKKNKNSETDCFLRKILGGMSCRKYIKKTIEIDERQRSAIQLVKKSYFKTFGWSVFVVLFGILFSYLVKKYFPLKTEIISMTLQVFAFVFAAMALGARGWDIQTWSGNSQAEYLNQKLFKFFSFFGVFVAVIAFYVG